ncbi:hypothetical protein J6590_041460 [Homalodisca vitripennis]|nr:hypothetical protein J6590_041460 [Homalodisca vitripennis]
MIPAAAYPADIIVTWSYHWDDDGFNLSLHLLIIEESLETMIPAAAYPADTIVSWTSAAYPADTIVSWTCHWNSDEFNLSLHFVIIQESLETMIPAAAYPADIIVTWSYHWDGDGFNLSLLLLIIEESL